MDFASSLERFEQEVICQGVSAGKFSKKSHVPVKCCKLSRTPFGFGMGDSVDTGEVLTIDYYGYLKKSKGFLDKFSDKGELIWSPIVHFAAIGIEDIVSITTDLEAIAIFPVLKEQILIRRGFRNR